MPAIADREAANRPLPTLPAVVARLLALYATEEHQAEDVAAALETDPALAGRVLRLANSAYYGFVGRVDTVQRAVVLLGKVTVQAVALAASLLRAWRGRALPPAVEEIWVHSYLCGVGCRYLGRLLPRSAVRISPDALFLGGLLHDVGKLLFLTEDPGGYAEDLEAAESDAALRLREVERFGRDHEEAGAELLEAWNLPSWLSAVVRYGNDGDLRAEFRAPQEVLAASHAAVRGEPSAHHRLITPDLAAALAERLEAARPEAEEFYRAIA
jgi:HD-like signal output (HDOD) protein